MYICFTCLNKNNDNIGSYGNFDIEGAFTFMMVVVVANVKILMSTHLYTIWTFVFSIGSTVLAFFVWFLLGLYLPDQLYGTFMPVWLFSSFYFGAGFIASGIIMVDIGLNWAQRAINKIIQEQEFRLEQVNAKRKQKVGAELFHRKVTRRQSKRWFIF